MPVLLGAALTALGCQDGYPIAATHCDRWCDIRQATECGNYNPTSCVVSCEQLSGGAACYPEFDAVLTCLEQHEREIGCDSSSYGIVRACQDAQQTLYNCAMAPTPHAANSAE